jgi:hypothetical protein
LLQDLEDRSRDPDNFAFTLGWYDNLPGAVYPFKGRQGRGFPTHLDLDAVQIPPKLGSCGFHSVPQPWRSAERYRGNRSAFLTGNCMQVEQSPSSGSNRK